MWQWVPEDDGGVQSCTGRLRFISTLLRCIGQVLPLWPFSVRKQQSPELRQSRAQHYCAAAPELCETLLCCCAALAKYCYLAWLSFFSRHRGSLIVVLQAKVLPCM